ncbi:hypothetical protein CTRI78_v006005 [Colletotrichum trifolii]|uniref:Uncharacterized protein n=1 Tax=Colletotrichum trifolii TaxID=5466 RepID=A0A4R8RDD2_COLTR|nr:hypothetical protein CTRI78_v006005 [Colletotrichum trifolii]
MPLASTTSPSTSDIITKASPLLLPLLVFHCSPAAHIPFTAKKRSSRTGSGLHACLADQHNKTTSHFAWSREAVDMHST